MKTLILATSITVASFTASANEIVEKCISYSELAETIMKGRQNGGDMAKMYNVVKGSKVSESLLREAFKVPMFNVESNKQKAVAQYKNETFSLCLDALMKDEA